MNSACLHLSCAVSADGYLDDRAPARAILSSPEDLEAVLALRAHMDMIVVGAETLRRDNPSLATRGAVHVSARKAAGLAPDPIKLVITRTGPIPTDRAFFRTGSGETIILSHRPTNALGTTELFEGSPMTAIRRIAEARDLKHVLIEGGAQILSLAIPHARFLRLAVSPRRLGRDGHARLFNNVEAFLESQSVTHSEKLGDTTVYHIDLLLGRARPLMEQAFRVSENCPPSDRAFAVGCLGCEADLSVIATGFSRETGPKDHAEEAMLSKADRAIHTAIVTLEPCLMRASKPTGCAQRLIKAGVRRVIYAVAEDETFTRQVGLDYLRRNDVDVIHMPGFDDWFQRVNAPLYGTQ
ncbi:MAG: dihydrofolate reductase family protein [Pseudomonadota bacterium]